MPNPKGYIRDPDPPHDDAHVPRETPMTDTAEQGIRDWTDEGIAYWITDYTDRPHRHNRDRVCAILREAARRLRARQREEGEPVTVPDDWQPTSENINALPDPLRDWIHDLETRVDPAGDLRARRMAEDAVRQLRATFQQEGEREPDVHMSRRFARRLLALLSGYRIDVDVRREARGEGPLPEGRNLTGAIKRLKEILDTEPPAGREPDEAFSPYEYITTEAMKRGIHICAAGTKDAIRQILELAEPPAEREDP